MEARQALMPQAETLARTRGRAASSFAGLAAHVGLREAGVHHHLPGRKALGSALLVRDDRQCMKARLQVVAAAHPTAPARRRAFAAVLAASSEARPMPLCCALTVECAALPERRCEAVRDRFQAHLRWLVQVDAEGMPRGIIPQEEGRSMSTHPPRPPEGAPP